jgi:hypothetical protein
VELTGRWYDKRVRSPCEPDPCVASLTSRNRVFSASVQPKYCSGNAT